MSTAAPERVIRFGAGTLGDLAEVCAEVGIARPLLVASARAAAALESLPVVGVFEVSARMCPSSRCAKPSR